MPDELAARLTPDQNIRAHAFNAVAPALAVTGDWLPLSVRQRVADAVQMVSTAKRKGSGT